MKKKLFSLKYLFVLLMVLVLPIFVFAQVPACSGDALNIVLCKVGRLLNSVIPVLVALGLVYFIWGVISYAIAKDEEAKTKGRSAMISGIIALLVITSVWGLVYILRSFLELDSASTDVTMPCVENPSLGVTCP